MADNSTFISYRRDPGYPWARLIWEELGEKGVDAFLDLESMRTAGRFDERLLNQIASRPYFIAVLTARTLDRCVNVDDWMRREIEHAIDTDRIIVPAFISPFEPSGFPSDLPPHIENALSQSQGLTVYSQYLSAATDKLANELLAPVELESIRLTEEDARFESRAIREVRSLPPPPLPPPPSAQATGEIDVIPPAAAATAAGFAALASDAPTEPDVATPTDAAGAPTEPIETERPDVMSVPTEPIETTRDDRADAPTESTPVAAIRPTDITSTDTPAATTRPHDITSTDTPAAAIRPTDTPAATTRPTETEPADVSVVTSDDDVAAATATIVAASPTSADPKAVRSAAPDRPTTPPPASTTQADPHDSKGPSRVLLVGGVIAAVLIAAVVAVVLSQGDDGPPTVLEADTWLEPGDFVQSPDGAHRLVMTSSGQLRLQTGGRIVWEPSYSPTPTAAAILQQTDGNFVVYRSPDPASGALWASGTTDIGAGATLRVIDQSGSGFAVIDDADGVRQWREPETSNEPPVTTPEAGETTTPTEPETATVPPAETAEAQLQSIVASDRPVVDGVVAQAANANVDAWVVQLGAKRVGPVEGDSEPWTHERILAEYRSLHDQFDAYLLTGADYNLNEAHLNDPSNRDLTEWYFFLVLDDGGQFVSQADGLSWCQQNRPGDCGVRSLSTDAEANSNAQFT